MGTSPMSFSFQKQNRLLDKHAYSAVFDGQPVKAGVSSGTALTVPSPHTESRLGIIVAKKSVRRANQRNRVKRVVREYFRLNPLPAPTDLIFLARHGIADKSNAELRADLAMIWKKLSKKIAVAK
jgi:ribonuclease P protein component